MFLSAAKHWKFGVAPLFAIALFTLYIWRQTPGHNWYRGDCAMYLMHVRQPETFLIGPSTYPAGYPLLLAPLYALYGYNFLAFKTLTNALLALSTLLIFLYVRRYMGNAAAWLIMFAVGLSKFYFSVWNALGSDVAFLTELFLVLLLQDVVEERGTLDRRPVSWGVILGTVAWYTYATRSLGAALFLGMILREIYLSWSRRGSWRSWLHWAALMATFVPLALASSRLWHRDSSYGSQFVLSPKIWWSHLVTCLKLFSYLWINGISNSLRVALWAVSLPLALWGLFRRVERGPKLSEAFFLCYMAVLVAYWDPVDSYAAAALVIAVGLSKMVAHELRWVGLFAERPSSILPDDSRFSGVVDGTDARYALLFKHDPDDAARLAPLLAQEPQRYVRIDENGDFEIYEVRRSTAHASYTPTAWNL